MPQTKCYRRSESLFELVTLGVFLEEISRCLIDENVAVFVALPVANKDGLVFEVDVGKPDVRELPSVTLRLRSDDSRSRTWSEGNFVTFHFQVVSFGELVGPSFGFFQEF